MKLQSLLLFILSVTIPFSALAETHKCTEVQGQKSYTVQFRKPSLFGDVIVVDSGSMRHLRFGNVCGSDQSSIDLSAPDQVVMEYVRNASLSLSYAEHHQKVLVVGMGGGVFSNLLARHVPDIEIDAIEIDPVVVDAAKAFFNVKATEHYRIHIKDAADYISQTKVRYDIIFLDAYGSDGIPQHLATKPFFHQVANLLNPGGVIVANFGLDSPRVYLQLAKRLHETLGATQCIHGKEESNLVVIAAAPTTIKNINPVAQATELDSTLSLPFSLVDIAMQVKECPQI